MRGLFILSIIFLSFGQFNTSNILWSGSTTPATIGASTAAHTHTTIDTVNIRAEKTPKADSINVLNGLRCKKLVVGTGTLMLDSIEIKDGTYDTLIIGAYGKKWKFLPISNQ
jgi:hypothetical protein